MVQEHALADTSARRGGGEVQARITAAAGVIGSSHQVYVFVVVRTMLYPVTLSLQPLFTGPLIAKAQKPRKQLRYLVEEEAEA